MARLANLPATPTVPAVNVRALGDPMKIAISVWYEYTHNGVDSGRCSRVRWVLAGWLNDGWLAC